MSTAPFFISTTYGTLTQAVGTGYDSANNVGVLPDGRIVVSGYSYNGVDYDFSIVRLNANGSLDTSFSGDGKLLVNVGGFNDFPDGYALQSDGKMLLAGRSGNGSNDDFSIVRLNTDGTLDTTFNGTGRLVLPIGVSDDLGFAVAVQTDGRIVMTGWTNTNTPGDSYDAVVVRLNSNGSLDTSFNGTGKLLVSMGTSSDAGYAIGVQPDGRIVIAGESWNGSNWDFSVARVNSNGALDTSFALGGKLLIPMGVADDIANSLAFLPDGRILISGTSWTAGNATADFAITRLNANGTLDSTFNGTGKLVISATSGNDYSNGVQLLPDGKMLLGGVCLDGSFGVVRLNANGSLDTTFNGTGTATVSFGTDGSGALDMVVQPDGKILLCGRATGDGADYAVARLNADGTVDPSFHPGATSTLGGTVTFDQSSITGSVLDSNVSVWDADFAAAGNCAGASLTLSRSGGPVAGDEFWAKDLGTLSPLVQGGALVVNGQSIGTVTTNSGGLLVLSFDSHSTLSLVNQTMQQIAFVNDVVAPSTTLHIDWTFSDGTTGTTGQVNVLIVASVNLVGTSGPDSLTGTSGDDQISGLDGKDTLIGNAGNDHLFGGNGDDLLIGGAGNDTLDGGSNGGSGDTASYAGATAGVYADLSAGTASEGSGAFDTLIGIENLTGSSNGDTLVGDANSNVLDGGAGDDVLRGNGGDDALVGGAGSDWAFYTEAAGPVFVNLAVGTATGAAGNDTLVGIEKIDSSYFDDVLTGSSGTDTLYGEDGNDTIDGGAGDDWIRGGLGEDSMTGGGGFDVLDYQNAPSGVSVSLVTGIVSGGAGNDRVSGFEEILGSQYADSLTADPNVVVIFAGSGDDTVQGGIFGGSWFGGAGNDRLTGGQGGDFFDGGSGDDTISGANGDDTVSYASAGSAVVVNLSTLSASGGGGNDLLASIERVRGSNYNDLITGDSSLGVINDLEGGAGNDTIDGAGGTDWADYSHAAGPVTVRLDLGLATGADGNDTLSNLEWVQGSSYSDDLRGDGGNNYLAGGGGNDSLSGGDGDDTLYGGSGNDTVDGGIGFDTAVFTSRFDELLIAFDANTSDLIVSGPEGVDRLRNVESLQLYDTNFAVELGSAASDDLIGGFETEMLRGGGGDDIVSGGGGNDALYGDEGNDSLVGGSGNDFIDGGTGADTMTGHNGDDTYVIDSFNDVVIETSGSLALVDGVLARIDPLADNPGGGVDTVLTSIPYFLGNFLERLTLTGTGNLSGAGNALPNVLTGNSGDNLLTGNGGDDTIDGADGVDTAGYAGTRSAYTLAAQANAITVSSSAEGTDILTHTERLQFADSRVAIDMQGNGAGNQAARLVGTIFGPAAVNDPALVGQYIAYFDAGLSFEEAVGVAVASPRFAQAAGSHSNTDYVNLVYENIVGSGPDPTWRGILVYVLDNGLYTQASMGTLAAADALVLSRIGFDNLAANGMAYVQQDVTVNFGSAGAQTLTGTAAADVLAGRDGDDVLTGGAGNDVLIGGAGIDKALYSAPKSSFTVTHNDLGLLVASGGETDQLMQVERIGYSNISVAYDLTGNAGMVAKIIGALFGVAALQDEALVGQYLALADAGQDYETVATAAVGSARFATEAGSHSNAAFVDRMYLNITGVHPDPAIAATLVGYLDLPGFTQGHLAMLAADHEYNIAHVNLTGLAQTGLEYLPA